MQRIGCILLLASISVPSACISQQMSDADRDAAKQRLREELDEASKRATDCPAKDQPQPAASQAIAADDFVELERTHCYGTCPVYRVRITANGDLDWDGERFVAVTGHAHAHVDGAKAVALLEHFQQAGFFSLCAGYTRFVTDSPTHLTSLRIGGETKQVSDYASSAPAWLGSLDNEVDALADTHRWRHGDPAQERFEDSRLSEDVFLPKPGVTPLMKAVVKDGLNSTELKTLLGEPGSVNAVDKSGWTSLMYAAEAARPELMHALLDAGADVNARSKAGETAMFAAVTAWYDPVAKVRFLKTAGADINARDQDGSTALMQAAQHYWMEGLLATMIELGADPSVRNKEGLRALDFLEKRAKGSSDPSYPNAKRLLQ